MPNKLTSPQMALPLAHADKASFDNFWAAKNTEVVAALVKLSEADSITASASSGHRVVYIYGTAGAGKSHLLFAAIRAAKQHAKARSTSYLSLSDQRVVSDMLSIVNVSGLVCLDDINAWAGNRRKERALFTLFEQVKHAAGLLLVSSSQPPSASGFVINDLVSRLSSGLMYPVYELEDDERFFAIKLRAEQRGLKMADDVVKYLLSRSRRDSRHLFNVLDQIDKASLIEQRRITIPFLQKLLIS